MSPERTLIVGSILAGVLKASVSDVKHTGIFEHRCHACQGDCKERDGSPLYDSGHVEVYRLSLHSVEDYGKFSFDAYVCRDCCIKITQRTKLSGIWAWQNQGW